MTRAFAQDLIERTTTTYVCTFVGLLLAGGAHWHTMTHVRSAAVAAIPTALAVLKGLLSRRVGDPQSAGLVPGKPKEGAHAGQ